MRTASSFSQAGPLAREVLAGLKGRKTAMDEGLELQLGEDPSLAGSGKPPIPEENEARVVGRILNHPKLKEGVGAAGDYKLVRFMLAVNRTYKDSSGRRMKETAYVPVVGWGVLAEKAGKAGKGSVLRVEGRLKTWQSEGKNYRWEIQANLLDVLDQREPMPAEAAEPKKAAGPKKPALQH